MLSGIVMLACVSKRHKREKKWETKKKMSLWEFPCLELRFITVKHNHCPALHADSKLKQLYPANYHPRKVGIHCVHMTRWCHVSICIWIKLLNQERINRGRAQLQRLSSFSHWLTRPRSVWAVNLCVHCGHRKISCAWGSIVITLILIWQASSSKCTWIRLYIWYHVCCQMVGSSLFFWDNPKA